MTRLPFLLEDLEREVRAIAGGANVKVTVALDSESFQKVRAALNSHFGKPSDNNILIFGDVQVMDEVDT